VKALSPFLWRRRVGMRDVDAWGVVWYGNYLVFCDEARAELLRAFDLVPGSFMERGFIAPVIEVHGRYLAPARFDEEIDVLVGVSRGRGTRMVFDFEIKRTSDQKKLAELSSTLVLVKTNGDLVYLPPDDVKQSIDRMVAAQAAQA
jgi:acyl-CoA thioester hydrolase